MSWRRATATVLLVTMGVWFVHEMIVLIWGTKDALISPVIARFLTEWPSLAFTCGALFIGHFSLPRRSWYPWPPPPRWGMGALIVLCAALFALDATFRAWALPPELTVGVGSVFGHGLWAQPPKA